MNYHFEAVELLKKRVVKYTYTELKKAVVKCLNTRNYRAIVLYAPLTTNCGFGFTTLIKEILFSLGEKKSRIIFSSSRGDVLGAEVVFSNGSSVRALRATTENIPLISGVNKVLIRPGVVFEKKLNDENIYIIKVYEVRKNE